MVERLRCCVPFCGHTTIPTGINEWVCAQHWRGLDGQLRRVYRKSKRRFIVEPTQEHRNAMDRLWERCKRKAIERAAGI